MYYGEADRKQRKGTKLSTKLSGTSETTNLRMALLAMQNSVMASPRLDHFWETTMIASHILVYH